MTREGPVISRAGGRRPHITPGVRWRRRFFVGMLVVVLAAVIMEGLIIWAGQPGTWGLRLSPLGPQGPIVFTGTVSCAPNQDCLPYFYAWRIDGVVLGSEAQGTNLAAGARICAYVSRDGQQHYVESATQTSDLNSAITLYLATNNTCSLLQSTRSRLSPATPLQVIIYLIIALVSALMAVLIALHATQRQLVGRAVMALGGLTVAFAFLPANLQGDLVFGPIEIIAASLVAPPFFASLLWRIVLPEPAAHRRVLRWIDRGTVIGLPVLGCLLGLNYALEVWLQLPQLAEIHSLVRTWVLLLAIVVSLLVLLVGSFAPAIGQRRDYARILGIGAIVGLVPLLILGVAPLAFHTTTVIAGQVAAITVVALPLSLAFVVLRRDLLGVDSLVRRTTERGLRVLGLAIVASALLIATSVFFQVPAAAAALLFVPLLVLALLSGAIQAIMSQMTEALFFPEVRRYRRILKRAAESSGVADPAEIATELIGEVKLALPVRQAALFVANPDTGQFARVRDDVTPSAPLTIFDSNHPVPEMLRMRGAVISAEEVTLRPTKVILPVLPNVRPDVDPAEGWELFVPMVLRDDLIGFLTLGERDDEFFYSVTDRSLLLALTQRRALALDYARVLVDLRQALEQQKELDQLKDQFIMTTHHELRTPLTSLLGYIELLREMGPEGRHAAPEDVAYFIDSASRSGDELERMMTTLLEADQHSVNRAKVRPVLMDVLAALQQNASSVDMAFDRYQRRIIIRCEAGLKMWADPQAFNRVLSNLMSNALKYSPPDSPVLVSAHQRFDAEAVEVIVRDWGAGIPLSDQPKVFERFVRLERDLNSPVRGTGLGLHVARSLVESMGGKIWVESTGIPGSGTTFRILLPVRDPGQESDAPVPDGMRDQHRKTEDSDLTTHWEPRL